jgi:galactose mutarotase-like enzyme
MLIVYFFLLFFQKGMSPYFGCIVGRVANRIKDGKFRLNEVEYSLPVNNGPNSLHGMVSVRVCVTLLDQ